MTAAGTTPFLRRYDRYAVIAMVSAAAGMLALPPLVWLPHWVFDTTGWLDIEFCITALVIVPLCLAQCFRPASDGPQPWLLRAATVFQPFAAACAVASVLEPVGSTAAAALAVAWPVCCTLAFAHGLVRFLRRGFSPARELLVDLGLIYLPLASYFFVCARLGRTPYSLPPVVVVLASVHFINAGTTALLLTAQAARWLARSNSRARYALVWSGVAGLFAPTLVAFGMTYHVTALELSAAFSMELGYLVLAVVTLLFVAPKLGNRMATALLVISGVSLLTAIGLAAAYSLRLLSIPDMVPTHGMIQTWGFCITGLVAYLIVGPLTRDAALELPSAALEPLAVPPPFRSFDDILAGLAALEAAFLRRRDRRGVFATAYLTMFTDIKRRFDDGLFGDPAWFARWTVALANRYRFALEGYEQRRPGVPACWQIAFDASAAGKELVVQDLLLGLNAHFSLDHALALLEAGIGREGEVIGGDGDLRHGVYTALNDSLRGSINSVQRRVAELYAPGIGVADRLLGPLDELFASFGVERVREEAWAAAAQISRAPDADRLRALEQHAAEQARAILHPTAAHPWLMRFLGPLEALQGPADRPPPGNVGLPWIGESLQFAESPVRFLYDRMLQYGPVFKTRVLGTRVVCLVGPDALGMLTDEMRFHRSGGPPRYWQQLLCWTSSPLIDGDPRRQRKHLLLSAFSRAAMGDYLAIMERLVLSYIGRWTTLGSFRWVEEMQMLSYAIANELYIGVPTAMGDAGASGTLQRFIAGFRALPIRLPFTPFSRALSAQTDLLASIESAITAHRAKPARDLMQRLLDARGPNGESLSPDVLKIETLHLYFASYGGMYAVLTTLVLILAQRPDVRERALREVLRVSPSGSVTLDQLDQLAYVDRMTKEVRRFYPLVAATIFANVMQPFDVRGYHIPAGWKAIGCIHGSLHYSSTFLDPERFDPDRFSPPRSEGLAPNTYVPHGAGPLDGHHCPGETLTDTLLKLTTVLLLRGYTWDLPPQNLELNLSLDVATPHDGLLAVFGRATAPAAASITELPNRFESRSTAEDALGALELRLETAQDRGSIFAALFRKVLRAAPASDAGAPSAAWLDRVLLELAQRYFAALGGYHGVAPPAPRGWQCAFESAAARSALMIQDLMLALNAHLNYDLPLAVAETGLDPDRAASRHRFDALWNAVRDAAASIESRLTGFYGPALRLFDRSLAPELTSFSLDAARESAWASAAALANAPTPEEHGRLREQLDQRAGLQAQVLLSAGSSHAPLFHALRFLEQMSPRFLPALDADEVDVAHRSSEPLLVQNFDQIIARLDGLISTYDTGASRLSIYPTVYVDITHRLVAKVAETGYFSDPAWIEGVDRNFASEYLRAIDNYEAGRHDLIPRCWQIAFEAAATQKNTVLQDLLLAINARLVRDMPIAVYRAGFAEGDVEQHRRDFERMHEIFAQSLTTAKATLSKKYSHLYGFLSLISVHIDNFVIVQEFERTQTTAMEVALRMAAATEDERQSIMAELDAKATEVAQIILLRGAVGGGWIVDLLRTIEQRYSGAWSGWVREKGTS